MKVTNEKLSLFLNRLQWKKVTKDTILKPGMVVTTDERGEYHILGDYLPCEGFGDALPDGYDGGCGCCVGGIDPTMYAWINPILEGFEL